jgi:hypothetical protein
MAPNYLNAHEITLGPTSLTWNETLGKSACARQFVEPYLMAGIKLHGFGSGQEAQVSLGELMAKRQRLLELEANGEGRLVVVKSSAAPATGMLSHSYPPPLPIYTNGHFISSPTSPIKSHV